MRLIILSELSWTKQLLFQYWDLKGPNVNKTFNSVKSGELGGHLKSPFSMYIHITADLRRHYRPLQTEGKDTVNIDPFT